MSERKWFSERNCEKQNERNRVWKKEWFNKWVKEKERRVWVKYWLNEWMFSGLGNC